VFLLTFDGFIASGIAQDVEKNKMIKKKILLLNFIQL
jgi:hypothetical protein